jgi:hypothetical protein
MRVPSFGFVFEDGFGIVEFAFGNGGREHGPRLSRTVHHQLRHGHIRATSCGHKTHTIIPEAKVHINPTVHEPAHRPEMARFHGLEKCPTTAVQLGAIDAREAGTGPEITQEVNFATPRRDAKRSHFLSGQIFWQLSPTKWRLSWFAHRWLLRLWRRGWVV